MYNYNINSSDCSSITHNIGILLLAICTGLFAFLAIYGRATVWKLSSDGKSNIFRVIFHNVLSIANVAMGELFHYEGISYCFIYIIVDSICSVFQHT